MSDIYIIYYVLILKFPENKFPFWLNTSRYLCNTMVFVRKKEKVSLYGFTVKCYDVVSITIKQTKHSKKYWLMCTHLKKNH